MQRTRQFAFRVSTAERNAIAKLAVHLQRSQSDAVRFVVIEATRQLSRTGSPSAVALTHEDIDRDKRGNDADP